MNGRECKFWSLPADAHSNCDLAAGRRRPPTPLLLLSALFTNRLVDAFILAV
jgi:hypothetical protein